MEQLLNNGYNFVNILKRIHPNKNIRDVCTMLINQLNGINIEIK